MSENQVKLSGSEIRKKFIEFFVKKHDHREVKSSSLIPDNPTVLLTTAGMLQFVPIFLGYENPPTPPRATSVQKCARAGGKDSDIENVGRTPRHHTFFEMLGNFSFGDYFKHEIIPWSWDFITNELQLDKSRLWITVFETDDESFAIWRDKVGVPEERILRKGKKDNFWGPPGPTGPCGPCTEIHYDLGEEYACSADCSIATCECDRFVEIWNLVFMELNKDEEGNFTPLAKKNVDTGMGLERITMVVNGKTSTFETDLLYPILEKVSQMSGKKYNENEKTDISLRIIADHARCVTFLITDGLTPGNEGRNYVLRMILRRALRHGKLLGLELPFLHNIVDIVVDNYKEAYPELEEKREKVKNIIKKEEERFKQTIGKGETLLNELVEKALNVGQKVISGDDAFKLYDTFGFPLELTIEMAEEKGLSIDKDGFDKAMAEQKERAKSARDTVSLTDELVYVNILNEVGVTVFKGYDAVKSDESKIVKIISGNDVLESAFEGDEVDLILNKTVFYAESGGQVGDTGIIKSDDFEAEVVNTVKHNDLFIHKVKILTGEVKIGDAATLEVDAKRRKKITIHHSTAHLLQSALRKVLNEPVEQAGSHVEEGRTRFDFTFDRALTSDEIKKIEILINQWIDADFARKTVETTPEEAQKAGAIALFGEKYGDKVRFVSIGEISKELCGGTHVNSTGEIRLCKILSESAIAAGVRRIELVCGQKALEYLNSQADELNKISKMFKVPYAELFERVNKTVEDNKLLQKQVKLLENEVAQSKMTTLVDEAQLIEAGKVLVKRLDGIAPDVLKNSVEQIGDKLGNSVVIMASVFEDKISIMAKLSQSFIDKGLQAGQIVNEIAAQCDGKGGGRPNFAQAGAKNPQNLDKALEEIKNKILSR